LAAHILEDIRAKLADRLSAKGLELNETELFIRDVIRIVTSSPGSDIEAIKGQLHLLGWRDEYTDYGTIQLIQACYQDGRITPLDLLDS
jgi:hypothetical protein